MDPVGVNTIETAALGRPFQLGMLYDCRRDALVPGIRLWSKEQLEQNIYSKPQSNTVFTVTASDSVQKKSKLLNIDGSLQMSFLGGLINVSGAANYLNDTKKFFSQQRLTLHYHSTCKFEEVILNQFASSKMARYDGDMATHVVTAVLYGADACFVFDRDVSSAEDKTNVAGEVKAAFGKLKGISVGAKTDLNESENNAVQNFSCTFYGDFQLSCNPSSFKEAMKVFEDLPKLLGENKELVVPLRVWLYPLDKLFSKTVKFQHEISIGLSTDLESAIETLSMTKMKCNDLLAETPALTFPDFYGKICEMKKNCYQYKLSLMKKFGSLLPKIRGKFIEDSALIDLLNDYTKSPFERNILEKWLKEKEDESEIIKALITQLNKVKVELNLNKTLMNLDVKHLVSYTFTSLSCSDELLSEQKAYLRSSAKRNTEEKRSESEHKTWLTPEVQMTMRNNLKVFKNLIDLNYCESVMFIIASKGMENNPGSCVLLYENESNEAVCFTPPSKPDSPVIEDVGDRRVILKVSPSGPDTEELKILYKMKVEKDWRSQPVSEKHSTVTLTDLRPDTEYNIKCAAVGKLNYISESDVIAVITKIKNKNDLIKKSILIKDGNPTLYRLQTSTEQFESYRKMTFGEKDKNKPHKTILMVGETGTGKTTLINVMINYMLGVQREDKVWFEITDDQCDRTSAKIQTSIITVYEFYLQESQTDLTIIDTPGYGDTHGVELYKEITESFHRLSKSAEGVREINAVCLVIMAHQSCLSERQKYIVDAVQSFFGKVIAKNIVLLFTHSTGAPPRNALTAVREAQIKCAVDEENQPVFFLFNNCQSDAAEEEYQTIQDQSWNLSYKGMTELFMFLEPIRPKMTQDVLQKHKHLEANISNLKSRIEMMELKQNELKQTQAALEKNKEQVKKKKNFEYEVDVPYKEKHNIDLDLAHTAMCCTVCKENCHYPGCWWVSDLSWCSVMRNNHCTMCTNKCHYSKHVKLPKIYVTKIKKEKRTYEELKKKYDTSAVGGESLVKKLEEELQELDLEKIKLVIEAFHCVETLQLIALNSDSLIILLHIDFLIEKLIEIKEPEKAETLENIKKRAETRKQEELEYL